MFRSLLAGRRVLVVLDNAATPCGSSCSGRCRGPWLHGRGDQPVPAVGPGRSRRRGAHQPGRAARGPGGRGLGAGRRAARVDAEPAAAQELARLCGRLPLALRIAAERVASRPRSALADLASELAGARNRLDLLCAGDDDATAVRAVFSWSYHTLSPAAAEVFRSLGLLAGPDVSAPAVAALIAADTATARQLLELLAREYLVEQSGQDRAPPAVTRGVRVLEIRPLAAPERTLCGPKSGGYSRIPQMPSCRAWAPRCAHACGWDLIQTRMPAPLSRRRVGRF